MEKSKKRSLYYCLFDWANSPFSVVVITFIFSSYFTNKIADDKISGMSLWGWAIAVSGIVIALICPFLGYIADKKSNFSKNILKMTTVMVVILCFSLWYADNNINIFMFLGIIVCANIFFEIGQTFYNSQLSNFKGKKKYGEFSGKAWAFGYLGGIFCLILILSFFLLPEKSLFKLNAEEYENVRICGPIVGLWFLIFSLPFLLSLKKEDLTPNKNFSLSYFFDNLEKIITDKNKLFFLASRMLYTDGLITLFSFGGIYATGTFNFDFNDIIIFGIIINITAALGAYCFGFLEDKIGIKKVIIISLVSLIIICLIILFLKSKAYFWFFGSLIGLFIGSVQSSSRTALIKLSGRNNINSLFGLYATSGKITNFLGPFLVATFTSIFASQKAGMATILIFLLLGLLLFRKVKL